VPHEQAAETGGLRADNFRPRAGVNPAVPALVGAGCISTSAIVVQLAHSSAGTTAFFRCALALPGLYAIALVERRRHGRRTTRARLGAAAAGAFLGVDLVLWAHSIYDVGAGIATVLGNLQVLFVTLIAWTVLGERPRRQFLFALPVVLVGVVLVAGLIGHSQPGDHPVAGVLYGLGTSVTYAVFILVLRRNTTGPAHVAGPLADASAGAALASLLLGLAIGQLNLAPRLSALGWFVVLALVSQTLGWLLITSALPCLPAAISSLLLLAQPASALVLADIVVAQQPALVQVLGAVLVCGGVLVAARSARGPQPVTEPTPG
jgi:drug/metabolite transporter (DMT)-like permease